MSLPQRKSNGDRIAISGDYQARVSVSGPAPQRFWHQLRYEACLDVLTPREGETLIDLGCGSGVFSAAMAAQGATVVGLDANESAVRFAQHTFGRTNLTFRKNAFSSLDVPAADGAALLEVLEHIPLAEASELVRALHAKLRPGGRVVVSTPNRISPWPIVEKTLDLFHLVPHLEETQHVMLYDSRRLRDLFESAGFETFHCSTIFLLAPWIAGVSWPLAKWIHRLEQKIRIPFGCLLVHGYRKKP